ncbi:hypothetical protein RFI_05654 [Reticulomyxa filosa]|uniref:Uncharacterized protein n=1 Tax=Reticulomyxa filosa TaxID=46433 RepID=X6P064_RETFI|nr:hypothetical protein RFI_05654 [Reticulomyxa filosa]|eukprot:ETO31464.1 hypothetical protein RFI_05654 [Reticulomyxa filosa]
MVHFNIDDKLYDIVQMVCKYQPDFCDQAGKLKIIPKNTTKPMFIHFQHNLYVVELQLASALTSVKKCGDNGAAIGLNAYGESGDIIDYVMVVNSCALQISFRQSIEISSLPRTALMLMFYKKMNHNITSN